MKKGSKPAVQPDIPEEEITYFNPDIDDFEVEVPADDVLPPDRGTAIGMDLPPEQQFVTAIEPFVVAYRRVTFSDPNNMQLFIGTDSVWSEILAGLTGAHLQRLVELYDQYTTLGDD